jgi:hypothetical protein
LRNFAISRQGEAMHSARDGGIRHQQIHGATAFEKSKRLAIVWYRRRDEAGVLKHLGGRVTKTFVVIAFVSPINELPPR